VRVGVSHHVDQDAALALGLALLGGEQAPLARGGDLGQAAGELPNRLGVGTALQRLGGRRAMCRSIVAATCS
jgi:hypothetical protein